VLSVKLPTVQLRQWPGGPEIGPVLRNGALLTILYGEEIVDGLVWVEVRDSDGRVGWIPSIYLVVIVPTDTFTPATTMTPETTLTAVFEISPTSSASLSPTP
jgi:hypothetical protein